MIALPAFRQVKFEVSLCSGSHLIACICGYKGLFNLQNKPCLCGLLTAKIQGNMNCVTSKLSVVYYSWMLYTDVVPVGNDNA